MRTIAWCTAALVGVVAGQIAALDRASWVLAAGVAGIATLAGWIDPRLRAAGLAMVVFCAAGARADPGETQAWDDLTPLVGRAVSVQGMVLSAPVISPRSIQFRLEADTLLARNGAPGSPGRPVSGRLEVVTQPLGPAARLAPGDEVVLTGRLTALATQPGYARTEQLRRQGIFEQMTFPRVQIVETGQVTASTLAPALRQGIWRSFGRFLPEPQASFAAGMLLGGSSGLSQAFRDQLQASGLAHFIAVDGFKLVLLSGLLQVVARRFLQQRAASLVVLAGLVGYVLLTGAAPSAVRAAIMVGLVVLAMLVGRASDSLTSVTIAAAAMALVQPSIVFEVGFQLSVSATLGLVLLYTRLRRWLPNRVPHWAAESIAATLAASLASLPVALTVFQQVSLVSPLAHVAATPLAPLVIVADVLFALTIPLPWLSPTVAWLVWAPTSLLIEVVRLSAAVPMADVHLGRLPTPAAALLGGGLLLWGVWELPETRQLVAAIRGRLPPLASLGPLPVAVAAATFVVITGALVTRTDHLLHVSVLGTARGQAVFIRSPSGTTLLVGGDSVDPRALASLVADELPAWERSLGGVLVLNSSQGPSLAPVLRQYPPASRLAASQDARVDLGGGAVLDVFANASAAPGVALSYGDVWVRISGEPVAPEASGGAATPVIALLGTQPPSAGRPAPDLWIGGAAAPNGETVTLATPKNASLVLFSDGLNIWPAGEPPTTTSS